MMDGEERRRLSRVLYYYAVFAVLVILAILLAAHGVI